MAGGVFGVSGDVIYQPTGNPFVDAGMWAICEWVGKGKPEELVKEDLIQMTKDITHLYLTDSWKKSQYSIFPNNPIINPSVPKELKNKSTSEKNKYKKKKYKEYLDGLLKGISPLNNSGNCISCGLRTADTPRTKDEIPLIGSGSLINYFPYGQSGGDYCPACTFAVQFSPLIMYSCMKLLLLHSDSNKVMRYWTRRAIQDVRRQILKKDYSGCFNENYINPRNALFHIIQDVILRHDESWDETKPSIVLYHFTNYIKGPDLDVYRLPTNVFTFLTYVKQHEKYSDWIQIVKRGYKKINWSEVKEEDDYKNKMNTVYRNLLEGKSITLYFIDVKSKKSFGDWDLLSFYLKEVRKMDEKRIATIKRVGDKISEYIRETENMKRLGQLERANSYKDIRNVLRFIVKDRVGNKEDELLFSLDEFVDHLFPDGYLGWNETQDLLLFRIYENLHEWLVETGRIEIEKELSKEENKEKEM